MVVGALDQDDPSRSYIAGYTCSGGLQWRIPIHQDVCITNGCAYPIGRGEVLSSGDMVIGMDPGAVSATFGGLVAQDRQFLARIDPQSGDILWARIYRHQQDTVFVGPDDTVWVQGGDWAGSRGPTVLDADGNHLGGIPLMD
jgi:hypothetical protein